MKLKYVDNCICLYVCCVVCESLKEGYVVLGDSRGNLCSVLIIFQRTIFSVKSACTKEMELLISEPGCFDKLSACSVNSATTEQIVTTLSRNRSLRKSLRESFRRLRSRSTAVRNDHTKSVIGDLSGSTDDKIGQQVEPMMSNV